MARQIPIVRQYMQKGFTIKEIIAKGGIIGACAENYFQSPVQVGRYHDSYIHLDDGRHRVEAAKIAGVDIPVTIVEDYSFFFKEIYSFQDKVVQAETSGAGFRWQGSAGNSVMIPTDVNSTITDELRKYGLQGIVYKNGSPDFSPVSCFKVSFHDFPALYHYVSQSITAGQLIKKDGSMLSRKELRNKIRSRWQSLTKSYICQRLASDRDFAHEFEKSTGIRASSVTSVKALERELNTKQLTMHETNDCSQIQFVSKKIHDAFHHIGGSGEMLEHIFDAYSHLLY